MYIAGKTGKVLGKRASNMPGKAMCRIPIDEIYLSFLLFQYKK